MKTMLFSLLMMFIASSTFAQGGDRNPYPRTITVAGSAEMEIVPDEIYVQVDLKEYEKKGQGKVSIEKIRQNFLADVRSLGIPDSLLSVSGYDGYNGNPWWRKKNKKNELYSSITYQLKLRSSKQVDELVDRLDDNATQNFYIQRTSHSKLAEFRKQLKIQAVRVAKEKGQYLSEAINEKIGEAVTINEPHEYYVPYYGNVTNMRMKDMALEQSTTTTTAAAPPDQPQADFKKIRLKYDVTVVFALK